MATNKMEIALNVLINYYKEELARLKQEKEEAEAEELAR